MESTSMERDKILEEYRNFCKKGPKSYYEYETAEIQFQNCDRYELKKTMGRGKYSEVYLGLDRETDRLVVIKLLKPVRKAKINREIRILEVLRGGPYIVDLVDVCMDYMSKTPALVFRHNSPVSLKQVMHELSPTDVAFYLYQILAALDFCHSRGIMHRDVKPNNIIIDLTQRELRLIDWGLSEFYIHEKEYNTRVSSRPYKSPELLAGHQLYDFSMDIWSLGCMLGAIIFKRDHMFLGKDNPDQLVKIVAVMGSVDFFSFINKFDIDLDAHNQVLLKNKKRKQWRSYINEENKSYCTEPALDLLSQMLVYDYSQRITAREAFKHPFFDPVRQFYNK
jgi:casein kinase II subunit alpha